MKKLALGLASAGAFTALTLGLATLSARARVFVGDTP
jgi:hypothetical protein